MIRFDHYPHHRSILGHGNNACLPWIWQKMIEEMTHRLVKLVRGALLPTTLPKSEQNLYGGWDNKTDLSGNWLTQIMHSVRLEPASVVMALVLLSAAITFKDSSLSPSCSGLVMRLSLLWRFQMIYCRWSRIYCWTWEFIVWWWLWCTQQKVSRAAFRILHECQWKWMFSIFTEGFSVPART